MVALVNMAFVARLYRDEFCCTGTTEALVTAYELPYKTFQLDGTEVHLKPPDAKRYIVLAELRAVVRWEPLDDLLSRRAGKLWQHASSAIRFAPAPRNLIYPLVELHKDDTFDCCYFIELSEFEFCFGERVGLLLNKIGSTRNQKGFKGRLPMLLNEYKEAIGRGGIHPRWALNLSEKNTDGSRRFQPSDVVAIENIAHRLALQAGVSCCREVGGVRRKELTENLPVQDQLMQQIMVTALRVFLADRNPKKSPGMNETKLIRLVLELNNEEFYTDGDRELALKAGSSIREQFMRFLMTLKCASEDDLGAGQIKAVGARITLAEKQSVIRWIQSGNKSAAEAQTHFLQAHNLVLQVKTVNKWLKNSAKILEESGDKKNMGNGGRSPALKEAETALVELINARVQSGECVSYEWVAEKARERSDDPAFKASPGWYQKFRKRNKDQLPAGL